MLGKWKRFGAFVIAAACAIAAVLAVTRGVNQPVVLALLRVVLIGLVAYLTTFVVWPRHVMRTRAAEAKAAAVEARRRVAAVESITDPVAQQAEVPTADVAKPIARPTPDSRRSPERKTPEPRPRPVGSKPAPGPHLAEGPPSRNPRGRRIESRQSSDRDFRWPARR